MPDATVDLLVVAFAVLYYAFLCVVYIIRGLGNEALELKLATAFSVQLGPFLALWLANLLVGADISRLVTLLPIIVYLAYDMWYRLLTKRKPVHHPKKWPPGLVVYLVLLMVGSFALNWYGFLVSKTLGSMLVACFFIMLGCFGYYQGMHDRRLKAGKDRPHSADMKNG